MSVFDYLEKVRQKSEPERRRLLVVWTFSLTVFIVGLWLINLYLFMPRADNDAVLAQKERFGEVRGQVNEAVYQIYTGYDLLKTGITGIFRQ